MKAFSLDLREMGWAAGKFFSILKSFQSSRWNSLLSLPVLVEIVAGVGAGVHERADSSGQLAVVLPASDVEPNDDSQNDSDDGEE